MTEASWRRCSGCKEPIALGALYYVCGVSTCNRKRTALAFCTVSCWEIHLPVARHREAWAEERTAPRTPQAAPEAAAPEARPGAATAKDPSPRRPLVRPSQSEPKSRADDVPKEILIVASRLKDYVRARSGYKTSERALAPLSDIVRKAVDEAIRRAGEDERKTVLDRDIPKP